MPNLSDLETSIILYSAV